MPIPDDILFGKIAIKKGFVSQAQIDECVALQRGVEKPPSIGKLLVEKGYLTLEQLHEVLELQKQSLESEHSITKTKRKDVLFGRLAVREGLITEDELNDCVRIQASLESSGQYKRLGEIMVEQELLTPHQVQEILQLQRKCILECTTCGTFFNIAGYVSGSQFKCTKCGSTLTIPARPDQKRVDEAKFEKRGELPLSTPADILKKLSETVVIPTPLKTPISTPQAAPPATSAVVTPTTPIPSTSKAPITTPTATQPRTGLDKVQPSAPPQVKSQTPAPLVSPPRAGIKVKCPVCDTEVEVPPNLEHRRAKCEKCKTTFTVEKTD